MKFAISIFLLAALISIGFFSFLAMSHGAGEHARCIADLVGQLQGVCAAPQGTTNGAASHIGVFRGLAEIPIFIGVSVLLSLAVFLMLAVFATIPISTPTASAFQKVVYYNRFLVQYFEKKLGHLIALRENSPAFF